MCFLRARASCTCSECIFPQLQVSPKRWGAQRHRQTSLACPFHRLQPVPGLRAWAFFRWSRTSGTSTWTQWMCCTAFDLPVCLSGAASWRACRRIQTCASSASATAPMANLHASTLVACRYGPFWVAATLVFLAAASGNLSTYFSYLRQLRTNPAATFSYDITKVSLSAALFFGYITIIPLMVRALTLLITHMCALITRVPRSGTLRCGTGDLQPARLRWSLSTAIHSPHSYQFRWHALCPWTQYGGQLCLLAALWAHFS